jgi:polyisoprenyl-phosphate glycosyltransferase
MKNCTTSVEAPLGNEGCSTTKASIGSEVQTLSIVIPCYNEEAVIEITIARLQAVRATLNDLHMEWVFVDDGSSDHTRKLLKDYAAREPCMKVVAFARNFGHQIAVTAGMDVAVGDALVILDADLQDPPEVIHQMIEKWREGYDVVYGVRTERAGEPVLKLTMAKLFYRVMARLSDVPIPVDSGDFRLISRNVIDVLKAMPERDRFLRGMVGWVGFRQIGIPYSRPGRVAGTSKFPLARLGRLALDGIVSFCTPPFRLVVALGLLSVLFSTIGILHSLFVWMFTSTSVEGWVALMTLFVASIQLLCIGVLGEYIGRIYQEAKRRPLYVIQEHHGFSEEVPFPSGPVAPHHRSPFG